MTDTRIRCSILEAENLAKACSTVWVGIAEAQLKGHTFLKFRHKALIRKTTKMETSKTLNALSTLTLAAAALVTHTPANASIADRLSAIEAAQSRITTAKKKGNDDEIEKDAAIIVANLSALIEL